MRAPHADPAARCHEDHCITCADEGVAMRVITRMEDDGMALCADPDGATESVAMDLIEDVAPGDTVLVHAGVALAHLGRAA
jgi:hydrogenase maturation factor